MLLLLLAVGLSLLSSPQAHHANPHFEHVNPLNSTFDETQIQGSWFSVALASNEPERIQPGGDMRLFIHFIEVDDRGLQFHLHKRVNGECVPLLMTLYKMDTPFQYKLDYQGENLVYLEEADPYSYMLLCTHNMLDHKETIVVELYSRTLEVSQDIQTLFKDYCAAHGVREGNIIDLTKEDRCLEAQH